MRLWLTFYLFFLVSTAAIAFPGPGTPGGDLAGTEKHIRVIIKNRIQIKREVITLGDIAQISTLTEKEKTQLQKLVITTIAEGESNKRIPGKYVESRIREILSTPRSAELKIPEYIEIEYLSQDASAALATKVKELVAQQGAAPAEYSVVIDQLSAKAKQLALDELDLRTLAPVHSKTLWHGRTFFSVNRKSGEKEIFTANIRWFAKRWVAKDLIQRGDRLGVDMFTYQPTELKTNKDDSFTDSSASEFADFLRNSTAKNTIAKDSYLRLSQVDREPDSKAGAIVEVSLVNESGINLRMPARLQYSARNGEEAQARILKTGRSVQGILRDSKIVEITTE